MQEHAEVWRQIPGFPDYAVSNLGNVKRLTAQRGTQPQRTMRQHKNKQGYMRVHLTPHKCATRNKGVFVHRLVLEAFVGPRPPQAETNHKDCNTSNNTLQNLEWVTKSQNARHASKNGRLSNRSTPTGSKNPQAKLTENQVIEIRAKAANAESQQHLAQLYNVCQQEISRILSRKIWNHI